MGEFRGVAAIDAILRDTIVKDPSFRFSHFVPGIVYLGDNSDIPSQIALMGGFLGEGKNQKYKSGKPDAVNTTLWILSLRNFSLAMVSGKVFTDEYLKEPLAVCKSSRDKKILERCLGDIWDFILFASSPPSAEKKFWLQSSTDDLLNASSESERVTKLTEALVIAFMNPYFILQN